MAGSTAARSAGVAYIDLAVGDTKKLLDGITQVVRQAADAAQAELGRGLDVSGHVGSFSAVVDAAESASQAAATAISEGLKGSIQESSAVIAESITETVSEAATAASESLVSTLAEAGRQAGEQLALDFEEATRDVQLPLFDEEAVTRATEQARIAAEELAREFNIQLARDMDASNASLGNVFSSFHFQGLTEEAKGLSDALTGGLRFAATGVGGIASDMGSTIFTKLKAAGDDGGKAMAKSFEEFKQGVTYSVGSWGIGFAIGNSISTAVSSALSFAKSAVIDFNSQLQSSQISFGTLLGSDSAGSDMLNQIKQFALSTPYQFGDLITASQKLLALGISAKNIIPDLRGLGDATSALGGDSAKLNEVTNIFGEMQSKGQIMEAQIRELQIRGIPALQILANEYGVSTTQFQGMVKQGKIMADDALPRLIDGLEHGTKSTQAMGGEMAKQSLTFKGSMSNLKDGVTQFAAGAGKPVFDLVNNLTSRLAGMASGGQLQKLVSPISNGITRGIGSAERFVSKLVSDLRPAAPLVKDLADGFGKFSIARSIFQALGPAILIVAQAIGAIGHNQVAAKVIADLVQGFLALTAAQKAFNVVMAITDALMDMSLFGQIALGITLLVVGFVALYQHSKTFRDILAGIGDVAKIVWSALVTAFNAVVHFFAQIFNSGPAKDFAAGVMTSVKAAGAAFVWLWSNVLSPVASAIGAIFVWLWRNVFAPVVSAIIANVKLTGAIFVWLWQNVIKPVVDGIWFALRLLFVIVFTLLVSSFVIAYHILEPYLKALWQAFSWAFGEIGKGAEWLWKNALKPAFDAIATGAKWLWSNALKPAFDSIAGLFDGKISTAVAKFWRSDIEPAFKAVAGLAIWLWKNVLEPDFLGIYLLLGWLGSGFVWLWKEAIKPAFDVVAAAAIWLWKNAIGPAFSDISDGAHWLYDKAIKPVFDLIAKAAKWLYDNALKPAFDDFVNGLKNIGDRSKKLYDEDVKPIFDKIGSVISSTLTVVKKGFDDAVSGIKSVWGGLVDILKVPVSFLVNTVYTNGIEEVWNYIADKVGIPKLPDAPHFADGGVVAGPRSAGDWIPLYATAGEGILTVDEMAALGGPSGFAALRSMLGNNGTSSRGNHFQDGGLVGSLWDAVKSGAKTVGNGLSSGLGSLESFASRITTGALQGVAKDMLKPVLDELGDMMPGPQTMLKNLITGIPKALVDKLIGWFGQKDQTDQKKAAAGVPADVAGWISQAETAAGVGVDWTAGLAQIISHESGGNPMAINLTDSNAAAGDPSRGLMQTIMSTFESFRLSSLPDDIYNPVANIVAGIRYIMSRYGSIGNVPGLKSLEAGGSYVGYATGTDSAMPGWAWVGENGPELMKFSGGESVVPARQSIDIARQWTAPRYSSPEHGSQPAPIVNVFIDGEKFDGRIDVRIDRNNNQLAQILNGGVMA
jgi:tape measure domain-containing protein